MSDAPTPPFTITAETGFGDLMGKVAIVTGGTTGIGLGCARGLLVAGASVAVIGRNRERLDAATLKLAGLAGGDGRVRGAVCDVGDEAALRAVFAEVHDSWGRLDAVICSHGVTGTGVPFTELELTQWRSVLATNLDGVFLALREGARLMIADETPGAMVVIGSLASVFGQVRGQDYSAGKGGVSALVRSTATELGRYGIRVNEVLPGTIDTPLASDFLAHPSAASRTLRRTPLRRVGQPDEIAGAVVYLVSDAARFHTGDALVVDGGYAVY